MNATGDESGVASYVTGQCGHATWHLNRTCAENGGGPGPRPGRWVISARTLAETAAWHAGHYRTPCTLCALFPVLNELADAPAWPGYHYLICDQAHTGAPCPICAELTAAGAGSGLVAASPSGHVALLRGGAQPLSVGALFSPARVPLGGHSVRGERLPTMTPASWSAAAKLLDERINITDALLAGAALYAPAASTSRRVLVAP